MAVRITTDGQVTAVHPANGSDFKLEELRQLIGCQTVELIYLDHGLEMWIDEEGKLNGSHINILATVIFRTNFSLDDVVMGNVLICEKGEVL